MARWSARCDENTAGSPGDSRTKYGAGRMTTLQAKTFDGSAWQHRFVYFSANAAFSDPARQIFLLATRDDEKSARSACIADDPMVP
jgi:hypothetical protein